MKNPETYPPSHKNRVTAQFGRFRMRCIAIICTAVAACLAPTAQAANILVNPGMEAGSFTGWSSHTTESWSMGAVSTIYNPMVPAHSGNWTLWMQGLYGNGSAPVPYTSYAYQIFACTPGSEFTADGWYSAFLYQNLPHASDGSFNENCLFGSNGTEDGWIEVVFLTSTNMGTLTAGTTTNVLAVYRSAIVDAAYCNNMVSIGATVTNITATTTNIWLVWGDFPVTNQYDITTITDINTDPDTDAAGITNTLGPGQYMVAPPGTKFVALRVNLDQVTSGASGAPNWDDFTLNQVGGPSPSVLGNVSPDGSNLFNRAATNFTFTVTSASAGGAPLPDNPQGGIKVVVNGVDQSGSLLFNGSTTNWNVALPGLVSNAIYNVSVTVSNSAGLISSGSYSFDTFDPSDFVVPSETYDFTNGMFIPYPSWVPTSAPAPNSYTGLGGSYAVDVSTFRLADGTFGGLPGGSAQLVRSDGFVPFQATGEPQLPIYKAQNDPNVYNVALSYNNGGNWENYTRIYPAGTYLVYARISGGAGVGDEYLNIVTTGYGTPLQETNNLGDFYLPNGADWGHYMWVPLTYGHSANLATVSFPLDGLPRTLQLLSGGGENVAYFILVPTSSALGAPPTIGNFIPEINLTNTFVDTTNITFSVGSSSSTIPMANVSALLNGVDVAPLATFTGNNTNWTVSIPVPKNQTLTLTVTAKDANGLSSSITWSFDTFDQNNFMIEAEDFDFDGGQFITNPIPTGAYLANGTIAPFAVTAPYSYFYFPSNDPANAAIVNVDLTSPSTDAGETFTYRPNESCGTQVATDFLRQKFIHDGNTYSDFNVGWWDPGTWINYTRAFPANQYFVYGRLASGGPFSGMTLSLVTSGVGTPTQTTALLGSFADPTANGWQNWHWVPLLDGNGKLVAVSLGGVETLRATSGTGQNANFYLFVPAIQAVNLTASINGNSISLKFPTPQTNVTYTVLYNSSLTGGSWQALGSAIGDGTTKTVTDTLGSKRFYKLLIQ